MLNFGGIGCSADAITQSVVLYEILTKIYLSQAYPKHISFTSFRCF